MRDESLKNENDKEHFFLNSIYELKSHLVSLVTTEEFFSSFRKTQTTKYPLTK